MSELESKEGVYSLEGLLATRKAALEERFGQESRCVDEFNVGSTGHANDWLARNRSLASSIDVTKLDLAWVNKTDDALFAGLSRKERQLLYLVFARDMAWKDVAANFDMGTREAIRWYDRVIGKIQTRIAPEETA